MTEKNNNLELDPEATILLKFFSVSKWIHVYFIRKKVGFVPVPLLNHIFTHALFTFLTVLLPN